jgi:DNA-binding transcriptional LysR family regulator
VALGESHPLAKRRKLRLSALRGENFISFPRALSPGLYDIIDRACRGARIQPTIVQEATQLQTIVALVCAGLGLATVPESMSALTRAGVVYRAIEPSSSRVETLLAWRAGEVYPAMTRLINLARQAKAR